MKLNLLLLDTGVIITLFELGIWDQVLGRCDVHISEAIVDEAIYFLDANGDPHPIDLMQYQPRLTIHGIDASQMTALTSTLGTSILERLDPGEAELLTVLVDSADPYLICSGDGIVYRILGALTMSSRGVSLEEVLNQIGLTKSVHRQYTKKLRDQWAQRGFEQGITGLALK